MIKPKRNSPYDPVYVSKRDNISIEEAEQKIIEYKKNKATSKEGFISRHGEEDGLKKFQEFQKTSKISSTYENFLKTYVGNSPEEDWKLFKRQLSKRTVDYWIKKYNISIEDAKILVSDYQINNSGVSKKYYINKGFTEEEILEIMKKINLKKDASSINGIRKNHPKLTEEEILEKYNILCLKKANPITQETKDKIRKTLEENGVWLPLEFLSEYEKYKRQVYCFTYKQPIKKLINYDKRGLCGKIGGYQLDHKYSIKQGFIDNVPPEILGNIQNLEYISWEENLKKHEKCSITIEELYKRTKNENIIKN